MKTSIKSIVAIVCVALSIVSATAATTEDPKEIAKAGYAINVFKGKGEKVNLLLEKVQGKKLNVTLRNAKGAVLFTETITKKTTGYGRRFDMSDLADGQYSLEVTDGETSQVKKVHINTSQAARSFSVN